MKVLVTGAGGFLGGAVVERLLAQGQRDLRCFIRPGSRRTRLEWLARRYPEATIELFEGNLVSAPRAAEALEGVGLVLHLAAAPSGPAAEIFLNTVVGTKNLLLAVSPEAKVVLTSSFSVYGVATLPASTVVDEATPLEPHPEQRDLYAQAKLRQERLAWELRDQIGFRLVVLRPGVIYGPGGVPISARIGLAVPGCFLHLGGRNLLPLTYVTNCAEAVVAAALKDEAVGEIYNVVDDDLPTCRSYLASYRKEVKRLRVLSLPYPATLALSWAVEHYHHHSQGQMPAFFTPYRTASAWRGNRFENRKLKTLGWRPLVPTNEGLRRTFASLRGEHMEA